MKLLQQRVVVFVICMFGVLTAHAQSDIDKLIEQTGIEAGAVAMRDVHGWKRPRKIVAPDVPWIVAALDETNSSVEFVLVDSEQEAIQQAADADAVLGYCSERMVSSARQAVWVQVFSAGVERCFDTENIKNGKVVLTNMQKLSAPVIAEHVTAMTLALARALPQMSKAMPDGSWLRRSGPAENMQTIGGKTMLVVGLGGIGTEVARRAAALDMRVVGTRRSSHEGPEFVEYVGLSDEMHELAATADFIVNALPLTPETTGIFDKEFFDASKKGAFFVNVGRGRTVVTDDLVAALESGQIAGAGLDVTEPEPLPADHPLWQLDNVLITPHVAGRGTNILGRTIVLRENLQRFVAGDTLFNVVDPEHEY